MKFVSFVFAAVLACLGVPAAAQDAPVRTYQAGQIWNYDALPEDTGSQILVRKVEEHPQIGQVIHISVLNLAFTDPASGEAMLATLPHLPMRREGMDASVTGFVMQGGLSDNPAFDAGYARWKADNADAFAQPVKELVAQVKKAQADAAAAAE